MTTVRRTGRWRGVVAVALATTAVGLAFKRPAVLLAAVVGVAYVAYPRLATPPSVAVTVDRRVDRETPDEGEAVGVEVRVENAGEETLADLRIVDGVPPTLTVRSGSPRRAATLRPGEAATFAYEVTARPGTHQFRPATVIARDVSGATEVETEVAAETTIECRAELPAAPVRALTGARVGRHRADGGGSGVAFHRTREYQAGDPLSRIDWRRYARTGELATTEFHRERTVSVVVCLDVRAPAYRGPDGEPHAVDLARGAADRLLGALGETEDAVGLASLGGETPCWLAPGRGRHHVARGRRLLAEHPALSSRPPDWTGANARSPDAEADGDPPRNGAGPDDAEVLAGLGRRLGSETQVLLLSPLTDEGAADAALGLEAADHAVTVVSPDVTDAGTVGGRMARAERRGRLRRLRGAGVRVVDWDPDSPLGTALLAAAEGWSE